MLQLYAAILAAGTVVLGAEAPQASPGSGQSANSGQPASPAQSEARKLTGKNVTLVGCVAADTTDGGQFTLAESKQGATYRLTGTDMREYSGRRVQVVGALSNRLHIVGGLVPSPNAAAQAGAIDTAQAIRESTPGTAAGGTGALPEFRVKRVRPVTGSCP